MLRQRSLRVPESLPILLAIMGTALAVCALLPPSLYLESVVPASVATALVAARKAGMRSGAVTGVLVLIVGLYALPRVTASPVVGVWHNSHVLLMGLLSVALAAHMVTPATTESSELRRRALFDLATDGIVVWDHDGRFIDANPGACAMLGYDRAEFLTMAVCDVVGADDRVRVTNLRDRLQSGGPGTTEWDLRRRDGQFVHAEVSAMRSRDGKWNAIVRDVSERARAERRLRDTADRLAQANRTKDEFLATLSHELRTPMQSIIGWSQMLMNGSLSPVNRDKALQAIHRNALVQSQLIGDLLDVSRIISGKLVIEMHTVDLLSVVEGALDTVRPAALNKGVTLSLKRHTPAVALVGDPDRLRQVVWNLLSNAVKFTPEGGRVDVRVRADGTQSSVVVADTGIGVAPEFLPFIFERFSQADGSTTKPHNGLGLGLAIARHLAHLHGGDITVASPGAGQGAVFTLTLPCRHPAAGVQPVQPPADASVCVTRRSRPRREALDGLQVLLVDDDPEAREVLRHALQTAGASVEEADSAKAALSSLERDWPDVLLTDIAMPGEDGYDLIRHVNSLQREHDVTLPSIALTAFARDTDKRQALAAGFAAHLGKPVEIDDLVHAVQAVVHGTPAGG